MLDSPEYNPVSCWTFFCCDLKLRSSFDSSRLLELNFDGWPLYLCRTLHLLLSRDPLFFQAGLGLALFPSINFRRPEMSIYLSFGLLHGPVYLNGSYVSTVIYLLSIIGVWPSRPHGARSLCLRAYERDRGVSAYEARCLHFLCCVEG